MVKVVIADSQVLARLGLKTLLRERADVEVVFEAADEEDLLEYLQAHPADMVVLDYDQPGNFSTETVLRLKQEYRHTNLLIISADETKSSIYRILELGVNSFLTKSCGEEEILDAVKATIRGEKFYCTRVLDYLLEKSFAKPEEGPATTPLSNRELEILQLVAKGFIAKEIAERLNLSTHTVYTHRKNILKKLGVTSTSELVLAALNYGLVAAEE